MSLTSPSIIFTTSGEELEKLNEIRDKLILNPATENTLTTILTEITNLIAELEFKANANETQLVSGVVAIDNFPAIQNVQGTIEVSNFPTNSPTAGNQELHNAKLDEIKEKLEDIRTYTDSLELLLTSLNGYVDGLESLLGTANSTQLSIAGFVDQLEGFVDGIDALDLKLAVVRDRLPFALGANIAINSLPVTLATDGAFVQSFGTQNDAVAPTDAANSSYISLFKRFLQRFTSLINLFPTNLSSAGRFLVDASIASFQDASLISETPLTAIGSTPVRNCAGYKHLTYQVDATGIGTNAIVRVEGNLTGSNFDNLNPSNLDTTLTQNKTYLFAFEGKINNIRFTLISFSGGSPSLTCHLLRGN